MAKSVAVVGAGITGLLTAFLISEKYPGLRISIYDAEKHPSAADRHRGVTHGSRDARHITGSESIGYENSIHKNALRNTPHHDTPGWLLKSEERLTSKERLWRDKFEATYVNSGGISKIDFEHAELNYKGLAEWKSLVQKYPFIGSGLIHNDGVSVYFKDGKDFEGDLEMESEFCRRYYSSGEVQVAENDTFDGLYAKKLIVPGMTIRVKSIAMELLDRLEAIDKVRFRWGHLIEGAAQLSEDAVVWTSGVTAAQPVEYEDHDVQSIVGCWITVPNSGYRKPFKIAADAPSAYMNFTPDGDQLHISGGFGWTGEYTDIEMIKRLAEPVAKHFVEEINDSLGTSASIKEVDYCIRPSTPTGQPLLLTTQSGGKTNIFISGSAKSGTTHAPVLAEYALDNLS